MSSEINDQYFIIIVINILGILECYFLLVHIGLLWVKKLIEFEQKVMDLIFGELAS